jgi:hypothetical protein
MYCTIAPPSLVSRVARLVPSQRSRELLPGRPLAIPDWARAERRKAEMLKARALKARSVLKADDRRKEAC